MERFANIGQIHVDVCQLFRTARFGWSRNVGRRTFVVNVVRIDVSIVANTGPSKDVIAVALRRVASEVTLLHLACFATIFVQLLPGLRIYEAMSISQLN